MKRGRLFDEEIREKYFPTARDLLELVNEDHAGHTVLWWRPFGRGKAIVCSCKTTVPIPASMKAIAKNALRNVQQEPKKETQ